MRNIALAALAAAAVLVCPRAAFAQYEVTGPLTTTTCNHTGGGSVAQETGCLCMNLARDVGSVSVQVTSNSDTLQFEVNNDGSNYVSANGYPLPTGAGVSSTTTTGIWQVDTAGTRRFCVRASAGSAATISMTQSADPAVGIGGVQTTTGNLTNNNAAPGATNVGALVAIANAAVPAWTEGNEVLGSVDLHGSQRATILNAAGTQVTNGVGSATNTGAIMPGGKDGAGNVQLFGVGVTGATAPANAIMIGGGSVAGATNLTGVTVKAASTLAALTDTGVAVTFRENVANDTTAISNAIETQPGVARATPTALTAGRSEKLELDTVTGAQYVEEVATSTSTGFSNVSISATASVSIKASAGNLYGFVANNGQATACFLQCVNSASAGTLGTAPIISFPLPLSTSASAQLISNIPLANFSTGIACGFSTAAGGASACGTASPATIIYK